MPSSSSSSTRAEPSCCWRNGSSSSSSTSRRLVMAALAALLAAAVLVDRAAAFKVHVPAGHTECISETISPEHFQVEGGARVEGALFVRARHEGHHASVAVRLMSPQGEQMWEEPGVRDEAHFNIAARGPGTYRVCAHNPPETRADVVVDLVYFTLGHLRRPGQVQVPKGTGDARGKEMARKDHLEDVRRNVLVVSELVDILGGEQRYLQRKLDRHIRTVKSNNSRTFWYTTLEVAVLLGVTAVNLAVTTGFFKGGPTRITV